VRVSLSFMDRVGAWRLSKMTWNTSCLLTSHSRYFVKHANNGDITPGELEPACACGSDSLSWQSFGRFEETRLKNSFSKSTTYITDISRIAGGLLVGGSLLMRCDAFDV